MKIFLIKFWCLVFGLQSACGIPIHELLTEDDDDFGFSSPITPLLVLNTMGIFGKLLLNNFSKVELPEMMDHTTNAPIDTTLFDVPETTDDTTNDQSIKFKTSDEISKIDTTTEVVKTSMVPITIITTIDPKSESSTLNETVGETSYKQKPELLQLIGSNTQLSTHDSSSTQSDMLTEKITVPTETQSETVEQSTKLVVDISPTQSDKPETSTNSIDLKSDTETVSSQTVINPIASEVPSVTIEQSTKSATDTSPIQSGTPETTPNSTVLSSQTVTETVSSSTLINSTETEESPETVDQSTKQAIEPSLSQIKKQETSTDISFSSFNDKNFENKDTKPTEPEQSTKSVIETSPTELSSSSIQTEDGSSIETKSPPIVIQSGSTTPIDATTQETKPMNYISKTESEYLATFEMNNSTTNQQTSTEMESSKTTPDQHVPIEKETEILDTENNSKPSEMSLPTELSSTENMPNSGSTPETHLAPVNVENKPASEETIDKLDNIVMTIPKESSATTISAHAKNTTTTAFLPDNDTEDIGLGNSEIDTNALESSTNRLVVENLTAPYNSSTMAGPAIPPERFGNGTIYFDKLNTTIMTIGNQTESTTVKLFNFTTALPTTTTIMPKFTAASSQKDFGATAKKAKENGAIRITYQTTSIILIVFSSFYCHILI